jgi:hypothetical protein
MVTARLLLHVASDEQFPGTRRTKGELEKQLEEIGLDIALKRSGRWSLVGGAAGS